MRPSPGDIRSIISLAVLMALTACEQALPGQELQLSPADRPLTLEMEDAYRLGGAGAEGWQAFQRIRDVGFDGSGVLYLLDQGASTVLRVGATGALVGRVGREGGGPGEFSAPTGMAVAADGTLAVFDLGRRSFALFGPDQEYLGNHRLDGSKGRIRDFVLDGGAAIIGLPQLAWAGRVGTTAVTPTIPTEGGELSDPPGLPLVRAPLDAGGAEVLRWTWIAPPVADGGVAGTAFRPGVRWARLPDGRVAVADSLDYAVHLLEGEGAGVWRRDIAPRPPTRTERSTELDRRAGEDGERPAGAGVGRNRAEASAAAARAVRQRLEEEVEFYPRIQVIQGLRADFDGRLWIERVGRDVHVPGPVDVIDARGRYLGTVEEGSFSLPDAFGPGGLAVWLSRDALDAPVVTVRRIALSRR